MAQALWNHILKSPAETVVKYIKANATAPVNAPDKNGRTPLHIAAMRKSQPIVAALVELKADINAADKQNITPLHIAAAVGALDIVQYLISQQVNIFTETKAKATAVSLATSKIDEVAKAIGVKNASNRYSAPGRKQSALALLQAQQTILSNNKGNWGFSKIPRVDEKQTSQIGSFFGNCEGKDFQTRQLGYKSHGKKGPSERTFFDLHSFEHFTNSTKIHHVSQYLNFPDLPHHSAENMAGLEGIPKFYTQMMMIPDYEPPNPVWGGSKTDGNGVQMLFCWALSDWGIQQLKENKTGPAKLVKRFLLADPNGDVELRKKHKAIAILGNVDELKFSGMLQSLVKNYNGKPFMTGPTCHKFYKGKDYLEVDCDVHRFTYMAVKAIPSLYDFLHKAVWHMGLVIQGDSDPELPEQMLGACRAGCIDLRNGPRWSTVAQGFIAQAKAAKETQAEAAKETNETTEALQNLEVSAAPESA